MRSPPLGFQHLPGAAGLRVLTLTAIRGMKEADRLHLADYLAAVNPVDFVWPWLAHGVGLHLSWGSGYGPGRRLNPEVIAHAAAMVARKRRIRLALAVSIICGVGPGAARLARWSDVDLKPGRWKGRWTIPRAHYVPAGWSPASKEQGPQLKAEELAIPERAYWLFRKARKVGDGWDLLAKLVVGFRGRLAENGGEISRPPRPPRPGRDAPVFPGTTPDAFLPEDALRDFLRTAQP